MLELKGDNVKSDLLIRVDDLIYFDGPLLSTYKKEDGSLFLILWVDNTATDNRWCVIPVEDETLTSFLDKEITLRDVINKTENVIFKDLYSEGNELLERQVKKVLVKDIPEEYMPTNESYFYE
ncbi:DUF6575 domain-containing protein [Shigella flexneri]